MIQRHAVRKGGFQYLHSARKESNPTPVIYVRGRCILNYGGGKMLIISIFYWQRSVSLFQCNVEFFLLAGDREKDIWRRKQSNNTRK